MSSSATDDVVMPDRVDRPRWAVVLAWTLFGIAVAGLIARVWLVILNGAHSELEGGIPEGFVFFSFPAVGVVLATKRPRNPLGWLMLGVGLTFSGPWALYARYAAVTRGGDLPGAGLALAFDSPGWVPFIGLSGFMLLLFPDGHLPTPRWRWFAWVCGVGLVILYLTILFSPDQGVDYGLPQIQNPIAIEAIGSGSFLLTSLVFAPLTVAGGAVAIIRRRRRTTEPVQRQQLRWLTWAAGVIAILYVAAFIPAIVGFSDAWENWMGSLAASAFVLIPITIGVAVMRYRLFEIDVVIRKTVVYLILAVLILAVGLGLAWIGVTGANVFSASVESGRLDLVIGVILGLLFWPLRRIAVRIADHVVFGGRATPYEVLTEFGDRLAGTYAADDVLERTAKVLGEGLGATRAQVWLVEDGSLRPAAAWRPSDDTTDPTSPDDQADDRADDLRVDVRHQGELLGALSIAMPANDPMDPSKAKLVNDLASQAGLLLRNVRLVEDLRASRRRLVAAQDQERRRLERNIHDGAQQQLVALAVKARLARQLTDRDAAKAATMLEQIESETQAALEDLRDLARGIYPPLLADKGLVAAIEAQGRRSPVPVDLIADGVRRFGSDVEAAAYFSVLESLQNVAKYAAATRASVALGVDDGDLVFEVTDDGRGFDPSRTGYGTGLQGIADRLGALDGSLEIVSAPGSGTTVRGRIPANSLPTPNVSEGAATAAMDGGPRELVP